MPRPGFVADVPVILDDRLRDSLVLWLLAQAHAWELQADGLTVYGCDEPSRLALAKAAVCKQNACDIHDALTRFPSASGVRH